MVLRDLARERMCRCPSTGVCKGAAVLTFFLVRPAPSASEEEVIRAVTLQHRHQGVLATRRGAFRFGSTGISLGACST